MTINDFRNIEFGVCFEIGDEIYHFKIPVDASVKKSLVEMRNSFVQIYDSIEADVSNFEPAEKYGSDEKLRIDLGLEYVAPLNTLYHHQNIPINNVNLSENLPNTEYYFAEFIHNNGSKTIGVKRPNQFKALLKKKNKIVRLADNTLESINDDVFKLDNDFDFLIHDTHIEILHPAGFIYVTDLEEQIINSIRETTRQVGASLQFINFINIADFITSNGSKRAAKLLASIKSRDDLNRTDRDKILAKCQMVGIPITFDNDGKFITENRHIVDFLEVLDRRWYDYDITNDEPEIYIAGSRKRKR